MLFRETHEIKKFLAIHKSTSFVTLQPYVEQAEITYLIPILGQAQYDAINTLWNSVAFPALPTLTPAEEKLIQYAQRTLAYYVMYEALPLLNTPVGDIGVQEQRSKEGTASPATQWRYHDLRQHFIINADMFAEQLIKMLDESPLSDYPLWRTSQEHDDQHALFINTTQELSKYINAQGQYRTFYALKPWISYCEDYYILPYICQPYFDELKQKIKDHTLNTWDEKALQKINRTLANWALYESIPQLYIHLKQVNTGMTGISVCSTADGIVSKNGANDKQINLLRERTKGNAMSTLEQLKSWLHDNSSQYPTWAASDCGMSVLGTSTTTGCCTAVPLTNKPCSNHFKV